MLNLIIAQIKPIIANKTQHAPSVWTAKCRGRETERVCEKEIQ